MEFLVVMLQMVVFKVQAQCLPYDSPCDPTVIPTNCCDDLLCVQVALNEFKCKEGLCEDHAGHECDPILFPCCPNLETKLTCIDNICVEQ